MTQINIDDNHILLISGICMPALHIIQGRAKLKSLIENHNAEIKRIEEMPIDMIKIEIELGFKNK